MPEFQLKNHVEYGSFEVQLQGSHPSPMIKSAVAFCNAFQPVVLCTVVLIVGGIHWWSQPLAQEPQVHVAIMIAQPDQHRLAHAAMQDIMSTSSKQFIFHVLRLGKGPVESNIDLEEGIQYYNLDHLAEVNSHETMVFAKANFFFFYVCPFHLFNIVEFNVHMFQIYSLYILSSFANHHPLGLHDVRIGIQAQV